MYFTVDVTAQTNVKKIAGRNPSRLYGNGGEARDTLPLPIEGKKL